MLDQQVPETAPRPCPRQADLPMIVRMIRELDARLDGLKARLGELEAEQHEMGQALGLIPPT